MAALLTLLSSAARGAQDMRRCPLLLLALQQQLLLALPACGHRIFSDDEVTSLYKCKDAQSDWPLPCRAPAADIAQYKFADTFPITAWWGPVGYGGQAEAMEFQSYVEANFVSHRQPY